MCLNFYFWSLRCGWSYLLSFRYQRTCVWLGWIQGFRGRRNSALRYSFSALYMQDTWKGAVLSCACSCHVVLCSVSDVRPHCCTWTGVQCVEDCLATLQLYWNRTNVGRWKKAVAKSYVSLLTERIHLPLVCVCHLDPWMIFFGCSVSSYV